MGTMPFEPMHTDLPDEIFKILNDADVGILIADADGIIHYVNHRYERIVQMDASDIIGKSVYSLNEDNSFRVYGPETLIQTVLREQKTINRIVDFRTKSDFVVSATPIFSEAHEIRWIIYIHIDIDEVKQLRQQLYRAYEETEAVRLRLQEAMRGDLEAQGIIVRDKSMVDCYAMAVRMAQVDATLLVLGETGTGKDRIAKYIHNSGARKNRNFVHVNCGAIPEALFESELFGYEPGSFTGAVRQGKMGLIELAHQGTLFLDEVAELPLSMQAKLLTVLQEKVLTRVGGITPKEIDIRIIAATNQDLEALVSQKSFRQDLYYRLNVLELRIPSLVERKEDIPALMAHYLREYNTKHKQSKTFSKEIVNEFLEYDWPGNVRELSHIIERLVIMCPEEIIDIACLPKEIVRGKKTTENPEKQSPMATDIQAEKELSYQAALNYEGLFENGMPLKNVLEKIESELIRRSIAETANLHEAANVLGIEVSTLTKKKQKYNIYKSSI